MRPALLDHIVVATPDLNATVAELAEATGVTARPGGVHPDFGTRNYLVGFGQGHYLELIGADPEQQVEASIFGLDATSATRVASWAIRPPDAVEVARRANEQGINVGDLSQGSRRTEAGDLLTWQLTSPLHAGRSGIIPFLIDWGESTKPGESLPAELEVVSFQAWAPEPEVFAHQLGVLGTDLRVERAEQTGLSLELSGPAGSWSVPLVALPD